ncbi:hypothetical protein LTR28_009414 [Elasticomyces elasticus]|nr:hypothetical protein LTR28_009414 [Elasticomyces elasticus]
MPKWSFSSPLWTASPRVATQSLREAVAVTCRPWSVMLTDALRGPAQAAADQKRWPSVGKAIREKSRQGVALDEADVAATSAAAVVLTTGVASPQRDREDVCPAREMGNLVCHGPTDAQTGNSRPVGARPTQGAQAEPTRLQHSKGSPD